MGRNKKRGEEADKIIQESGRLVALRLAIRLG